MGSARGAEPMWFDKPMSSVVTDGGVVAVPKDGETHHEVELGILWGKTAKNIRGDDWQNFAKGVFVGIDFTNRVY